MRERPHLLRVFLDVSDPWARRVLRDALGARTDVRFVASEAEADVRVGDPTSAQRVQVAIDDASAVRDAATDQGASPLSLTEREHDVLQSLAEGLSNGAIGERLGITRSTVKFHLASLYEKLGVHGRAEAVAMGVRRGDVLL